MPLKQGSSNQTRSENIATEIRHGKSPEQAAAIGYSVQRANHDTSSVESNLPLSVSQHETAECSRARRNQGAY